MAKKKEEGGFGFSEKYNKYLKASTFKDDVNTMDEIELKKVIYECEKTIKEIEKDRDTNEKLKEAREIVTDISGGYRDAIGYETAKIKYSLYTLETRGKI